MSEGRMPRIWGHRGCRGLENPPEGSRAAFREALRQGADGVELDVFLSKALEHVRTAHRGVPLVDQAQELVVFHDLRLGRMTRAQGHTKITDIPWSTIQKLRLKHPRNHNLLTNQTIPRLDDVLDIVEQYRTLTGTVKKVVNIEEKGGANLSQKVAQKIQARIGKGTGWHFNNFLVSSFDMSLLRDMRAENEHIPVGTLFEGTAGSHWNIDEDTLERKLREVADIKPETVNITYGSLTDKTAGMIHDIGAHTVIWMNNERNLREIGRAERESLARNLFKNADVIITDYPGPMRHMLHTMQAVDKNL